LGLVIGRENPSTCVIAPPCQKPLRNLALPGPLQTVEEQLEAELDPVQAIVSSGDDRLRQLCST